VKVFVKVQRGGPPSGAMVGLLTFSPYGAQFKASKVKALVSAVINRWEG